MELLWFLIVVVTVCFVKVTKHTLKRLNFTVCELHTQQQILKENLLLRGVSGEFLGVHGTSVMWDLQDEAR